MVEPFNGSKVKDLREERLRSYLAGGEQSSLVRNPLLRPTMAKNDVILLDGIIDQRVADRIPSGERDEVFEYFVLEETLKDYDLSHEELESGWIDGWGDGGLDGFYIFVNGHLLDEADDFAWPRSNASIDVWLFTSKHHSTFRQATLDAVLATIQELFDFSIADEDLQGSYSTELRALRTLFALVYRRLSITRPKLTFNVVYASRGDSSDVGDSVQARARQVRNTLTSLFSSSSATFRFVGATELVEMHRRARSFCLDLPFVEHLATERNSYVLLVRLEDYWKFVSDESGALRRYLFDSNVRDYLGAHGVNEDISRSLTDESAPDFWWLNNGVTILATDATVPGKTVQLKDIQIVNGLQTTETIHRHFQTGSSASQDRAVLVKVIVSSDPLVRDRIIRATNNQSPVELAALHATDKIQRDIEVILERHEWYYERRKNYYRNIGKPQNRFVTPLYLASAVVALVLKNPRAATKLRAKFMRTPEGYESVFSEAIPIEVWPRLVDVYKAVEAELPLVHRPQRRGERFVNTWRPLVALLVVARRLQGFDYRIAALAGDQLARIIEHGEVADAWSIITATHAKYDSMPKIKPSFISVCCDEAATRYGLSGKEVVGKRGIGSPPGDLLSPVSLQSEFLNQVDAILPPQPWKPGVHIDVARKLNCSQTKVSRAIKELIASGKRNDQKDGVVYDSAGAVIAFDPDRVGNPE